MRLFDNKGTGNLKRIKGCSVSRCVRAVVSNRATEGWWRGWKLTSHCIGRLRTY